ncbi:MAG: hypothetical protein U0796_18685 [Gemmatales bacterium]
MLFFLAALPMGIIAAVMGSTYFLMGPIAALMPEARGEFTIVPWLALLYVPMMVASAIRFNGLTVVLSVAGFVLWHVTGILVFGYLVAIHAE